MIATYEPYGNVLMFTGMALLNGCVGYPDETNAEDFEKLLSKNSFIDAQLDIDGKKYTCALVSFEKIERLLNTARKYKLLMAGGK